MANELIWFKISSSLLEGEGKQIYSLGINKLISHIRVQKTNVFVSNITDNLVMRIKCVSVINHVI